MGDNAVEDDRHVDETDSECFYDILIIRNMQIKIVILLLLLLLMRLIIMMIIILLLIIIIDNTNIFFPKQDFI